MRLRGKNGMEKIREALFNWKNPANIEENESEKCCGGCRFSRMAPDLEMKCIRHKIQTAYVCRCGDWQGKESVYGRGA